MIKVTFEYPDLESLMAAMARLGSAPAPAVIPATVQVVEPAPVAVEEPVKAPKPVKAAKPAATPAAPAPEETTAQTAEATPATASPSDAPLTYEPVGAAIVAAVKQDKAKVVALLAKYGVARGPELKAEQYADFLKELTA